ncbi:Cytochrome P450 [Mycena sanguinolenta]|uniref:Cytochrome P450 n=1 Tax=Mycena sanguinolenta TaxID=230812 RepID=A0A8H6X693_9AGAR|nr:Cytochrome P450 [Mycena sanguinolenta]
MEFTLAVAVFSILLYALRWNRNRSKLPLPPGPRKLPLVGNFFDMPTERQWETFLKWSKQFSTSIVVLSSIEAVKELFEKRSALYSGRPRMPMVVELMGCNFLIAFMEYGNRWRSHRKMFYEGFNVGAVEQFQPQELAATHELLRRLLRGSADVVNDFRHFTGAVIMNITYGIDIRGADDKYIKIAKEGIERISTASMPGAFLVDSIPALKYVPNWIPGTEFKRKAINWKKIVQDSLQLPFAETQQNIATGTARTSFTSINLRLVEELTGTELEEQEAVIKATAANMYLGAVDTTVSALGTFILAMLLNPEAQKKAQAEIDSVVGSGQLPGFADKPTLPYVSAIVKEVLRWRNVTPLGFFFPTISPWMMSIKVTESQRIRLSLETHVLFLACDRAILHDEAIYPDPHSFKPERFLLSEGKLNPAIRDPETVAFGFGRRICPGRHMAVAALWIVVVSILSTFNIDKAIGEDDREIEPSHEYSPGVDTPPVQMFNHPTVPTGGGDDSGHFLANSFDICLDMISMRMYCPCYFTPMFFVAIYPTSIWPLLGPLHVSPPLCELKRPRNCVWVKAK